MCFGAMLATSLQSRAAKMSPAAVSAVINTSSSMFSGYFAQVVFFDTLPDVTTVCGAVLMLVGVCIVILLRMQEVKSASDSPPFGSDPKELAMAAAAGSTPSA